jgi:hypothetical protein
MTPALEVVIIISRMTFLESHGINIIGGAAI